MQSTPKFKNADDFREKKNETKRNENNVPIINIFREQIRSHYSPAGGGEGGTSENSWFRSWLGFRPENVISFPHPFSD